MEANKTEQEDTFIKKVIRYMNTLKAFFTSKNKRADLLLLFLFLWGIIITGHLFYYTIYNSEKYIKMGNRLAKREGIIYAKHGKVYDRNNIKLSWSINYTNFVLNELPKNQKYSKKLLQSLKKKFPHINIKNKFPYIIKSDISPTEEVQLTYLTHKFPELKFTITHSRKYKTPAIIKLIEKIESTNRDKLYGKNGLYEVMADKTGKWIPGTWKEKIKVKNGMDIKLDKSLDELIGNDEQ